jgi:peptidyl-prolyl cis-trans isomerase B (cyclophilin B)
VGKFIMIVALILLNAAKSKTATSEDLLNLPPQNSSLMTSPRPSILSTQSANQSANVSKKDNISIAMTAVIKTERGNIELTLYSKEAPKAVQNFVQKAKSGFYNNLIFHRVEDWVIQGGDPLGNGTGGGNMPVEFNNKPFVEGSIGVASRGDGKVQNDAQFFIIKKDSQFLNGKYTNFGIVIKGMDVVNKIVIGSKILGINVLP